MAWINLAKMIDVTEAEGPGLRAAIWVQGCLKRCQGCCNGQFLKIKPAELCQTSQIIERIQYAQQEHQIEGITLLGGEPFLQAEALIPFATIVKKNSLNLIAYTGYYFEDLLKLSAENTNIMELLKYIDVLIDGPFVLQQKDLSIPFRGSKNQRLVDVKRSLETGNVVTLAQI